MSNCSQCGSFIPDGQQICSMCMGDMNHGSDGYYEKWAQEQLKQQGRGEWEGDEE
jgi:predicted amidophosphoribosyltransferase